MNELTPLERSVLQYVQSYWKQEGIPPGLQQIATQFGFESESIARRHVSFLHEKGYLVLDPSENCGLRVWTPWSGNEKAWNVPLFGTIPCGVAEEKMQEAAGYIPVELESLGIKPSSFLFAVEARGDSMIGRQIAEGDYVILDKNRIAKSGDVVAALVDGQSTLKTFVRQGDKVYLRPENPKYKNIIPAEEAMIQGVMVLLIRKAH